MLPAHMLGKRNIFLIGPMGSGKSAVGKYLARLVRAPFIDSDTEIERRTGVDIPYIFEKEGEAGFRERSGDSGSAHGRRPHGARDGRRRSAAAAKPGLSFGARLRGLPEDIGGAAGSPPEARAQPAAAQQRGSRREARAAHARARADL
jgi:hypothetical protein